MKSFFVYILECSDGSYYTGHTDDLEKRIMQHMHGCSKSYTSKRLPIKLVFSQVCPTRYAAKVAERRIKGWCRAKKKMLIKNGWEAMQGFAKQYGTNSS